MDRRFGAVTTAQIAERKAVYRKIRGLSNVDVARVMEFIDSMEGHEQNFDPFYSESNMKHLLSVKYDAQNGINMSAHDLIEVNAMGTMGPENQNR